MLSALYALSLQHSQYISDILQMRELMLRVFKRLPQRHAASTMEAEIQNQYV